MANCLICTIEFYFEGQKHSFILHDKQSLTWNNLTVLIWFMNVLSRLLLASFIICFTEAAKEPKEKQLLCPKTFAVRDRWNKYAFKIRLGSNYSGHFLSVFSPQRPQLQVDLGEKFVQAMQVATVQWNVSCNPPITHLIWNRPLPFTSTQWLSVFCYITTRLSRH